MPDTTPCPACGHDDPHTALAGCTSTEGALGYCPCEQGPAAVPMPAEPIGHLVAHAPDGTRVVTPVTARLPEPPPSIAHDGETYDPAVDAKPLNRQQQAVYQALTSTDGPQDTGWWTLAELAATTGFPEASVSARLRDLRKPKWGGHQVERRRRQVSHGVTRTWEYRLVPSA